MRLLGLVLLVLPAVGLAYQADLVPASERPEARDITGQVGIGGASGNVHVSIDNVNDLHGDPLGQATLVVQLRIRVNGLRRRATLPLPVDGGNGSTTDNLGLRAGDRVVVSAVRVRGPDHHTLAEAGLVTAEPAAPPAPPPSPDQCPAALQSCQSDLDQCNQDLDACLSGG